MATPQERGRLYERELAETWGAKEMPASGATPRYKLDLGTLEVIISAKHTDAESFRVTAKDVRELLEHAGGPGSRDQVGVLLVRIAGVNRDLFIADGDVMLALLRGEVQLEAPPSKAQTKRAAAMPPLLRGEST